MMDLRYSHHPESVRAMDTARLRQEFLLTGLFDRGAVNATYSLEDRLVVAGICPDRPTELSVDLHRIGSSFLLERRELGIINLGGAGSVVADGTTFNLKKTDVLYVSRGTKRIQLDSDDPGDPARFLCLSGPSHADYPTTHATVDDANIVQLGSTESCNERTLYQFVHQNGVRSANLVMGFTHVKQGSVWNTMPCHTHTRRMELYCYFDVDPDHRVFHLMGEPQETRHIVMADGDAVLSPSWSIHSGVGTSDYSFVWAMLGDNQTFDDMDKVAIGDLL